MTYLQCVSVPSIDAERLIPILHDAEEDDDRIRAALRKPGCDTYAMLADGKPIGAAVVRWPQPAEIQAELAAHGHRLLVGTANCALDNIAFYQKCGFRLHSVKRDYFDFIQPPLREHDIVMRDLIVFSYDAPAA